MMDIIPYKFIVTNTQVLKLCKVFTNNSSANLKLLKTKLYTLQAMISSNCRNKRL